MSAAKTQSSDRADVRTGTTAATAGVHLYRHALECIFAFLDLPALAAALRVNGAWRSAVESMRTAGLERHCPRDRPLPDELAALLSSPSLSRHIVAWFQFPPTADPSAIGWLSAAQLAALLHGMPHPRKLGCAVALSPAAGPQSQHRAAVAAPLPPRLPFPAGLVSLQVRLHPSSVLTVAGIPALDELPHLESVQLELASMTALADPLPLWSSLPRLHTLALSFTSPYAMGVPGAQLNELRALPHLTSLSCTKNAALQSHHVCYLLRDPDPATVLPRLEHLGDIELTDESAVALVAALPSLRSLFVSRCEIMSANKFDFLVQLPFAVHVASQSGHERPSHRCIALCGGDGPSQPPD
jgi:hypothetical protein